MKNAATHLIAERWNEFKGNAEYSPAVLESLRKVFYAGAMATMECLYQEIKPGIDRPEVVQFVFDLTEDIKRFVNATRN